MNDIRIIRREPRKTTNHGKTNHQGGIEAEEIAATHLQHNGYRILARRYKCKQGEIDIIAEKDGLIAFVEVKSRRSELLDDPIGKTGKRRIAGAALQYISENPEISNYEMRFDFIFVDSRNPLPHTEQADSPPDNRIQHIESAWIMEN